MTRFVLMVAFMLLTILALSPVHAESDEIPGYGWKQKESYSYSQGDVQSITDILFRGGLTIKGPLNECDISEIMKLKFAGLDLLERADPSILGRKDMFPDLDSVYLRSEDNSVSIRLLHRYHRNISTLVIEQKKALNEDVVRLLADFEDLSYLQLSCPLERPAKLVECLPPSLSFLNLFNTGVGSIAPLHSKRLSSLKRLSLNEPASSAFLEVFDAPLLEELELRGEIERCSIRNIYRFRNLRYLVFNRQTPPIDDLGHLAEDRPPGRLIVRYYGENEKVSRLVDRINDKASKKFNPLRLRAQLLERVEEFLISQLKPKIKCTIQNRSPDGYDIICDQARGVLMTEKRYSSGQSLNAYFITKCRGRYLLTDSLSSLFKD